jgi:trans-aconitate methyltransferase
VFSSFISFIRRKISPQYKFDQQFASGKWDGLHSSGELARYSIIVGYALHFCKSPAIADLGCGEGILSSRFPNGSYSHIHGVDFSSVAIEKARGIEKESASFQVADLNNFLPEGSFDIIVYNESIYYLTDPVAAIRKLLPCLAAGGYFIISIVDKHGKEQAELWELIHTILKPVDKTVVKNAQGHSWTIEVLAPYAPVTGG